MMIKIPDLFRRWIFFVVILSCQIPLTALAQDESAIRPIIDAKDLEKLIKADKLHAEADRILEDEKQLQKEIKSLKDNSALTQREIKRKTDPLEIQSRQKRSQASSLFEKCNEMKFTVYKKYLDKFWKEHSGEESGHLNAKLLEEQASDVYFQAAGNRIEAKHMNDSEVKIEKLSEADRLEADAIQKQLSSLAECYGIPFASVKPDVQEEKDTLTANVQAQETIVEPPVSKSDADLTETAIAASTAVAVTNTEPAIPEEIVPEAAKGEPAREEPVKAPPAQEGVSYRVQLMASRVALTREQIAQTYKGNEPVEVIQEAGWYKYQLNGGNSLKKAQELRAQCGISGAFIVPYRNGVKITFKEAATP